RCSDSGCFFEALFVFVDGFLAGGRVFTHKKTAADERDSLEVIVAQDFFRLGEWTALQPLTPDSDTLDSGGSVLGAGCRKIPWLGRHGVDGEFIKIFHGNWKLRFGAFVFD